MGNAVNREELLRQNLVDAGWPVVRQCMGLAEAGKTEEHQQLLGEHRQRLPETVHMGQRRIDCLDFLLYQIKRGSI